MANTPADLPSAVTAQPPSVRRNVMANYVGGGWSAAVSLVFVPMYIRFLGAEAYGLVGFFVTLQALVVLLDMGLSAIANREMARRSQSGDSQGMRDLTRTLEIVFWAMAGAIALAGVVLSAAIASHWLRNDQLSSGTVTSSVALIAVAIGVQWPASLYAGVFFGLQQHVSLNFITAGGATVRAIGALVVLWLVSPSIIAFFSWYVIATLGQTAVMAVVAWRLLPQATGRAQVRWELVRAQRQFAVGVTGTYALTLALTQLDKVILSRLLSLRSFGYYALAAIVAMTLHRFATPVVQAVYPRLTQLASVPDARAEMIALYHRSSQSVSVLIVPAAVLVSLFSHDLLLLWTRDATTAAATHQVLSLLVLGTSLYGLASLPHALQLAHGWTRLALVTSGVAVALLVPGMILGVREFGPVGAAAVWLGVSAVFLLANVHFSHARLLGGGRARWLRESVAAPFVISGTIGWAGRTLMRGELTGGYFALGFVTVAGVALGACILVTPSTREMVQQFLRSRTTAGFSRTPGGLPD